MTMGQISSLMPYHSHIDVDIAIKALNRMIDDINAEKTVFYSIYTERKARGSNKNNTGLFFYRGNPRAPFAIICPGGGFAYVASLHEGFPYALEINKRV